MGLLRAAKFITYMQLQHPTNPKQIKNDGWKLTFLGSSGREAYKIYGTSLVVKFPGEDINQGQSEIRALRNVHKYARFKKIRKYAPSLYYGNLENGVVVMDYVKEIYKPTRNQKIQWSHVRNFLCKILKSAKDDGSFGGEKNIGNYIEDFWAQFGYTKSGQIKLYDWGFPGAADF